MFAVVNAAFLAFDIDPLFIVSAVGLPLESDLTAGVCKLGVDVHEVALDGVCQGAQRPVPSVREHHFFGGLGHDVKSLIVRGFATRNPVHVGAAFIPELDGMLIPIIEVAVGERSADWNATIRGQVDGQYI